MSSAAVIIPTYHPGSEFETLLERLSNQSVRPKKILVMNTDREGWNPAWESWFPLVTVEHLTREEFDHGGTRKAAAAMCQEDYLVFLTQDALPADELLLEHLLAPLEANPRLGASFARQLPKPDAGPLEKITRAFNYPSESHDRFSEDIEMYGIKTYFCSNVCAAYRRETYETLGGFCPRTIFNEDMIYAGTLVQNGYGIHYAADAQVFHSHNYSGFQQFHRNFDLGVSQAEHPEIFASVPSEGEGIRLVKRTCAEIVRAGQWYRIPQVIWQNGWKYLGYLLGKRYRKLPRAVIRFCTMNASYWKW